MKKTSIGGQALLEGIMMRGPEKTAMAVRREDKTIYLDKWDNDNKVPKFWTLPVFRGMYNMVSSFIVGYKCLGKSADIALEEELAKEEAQKKENAAEGEEQSESDKPEEKKKEGNNKLTTIAMVLGVVLALALVVTLFVWLPTQLFSWLMNALGKNTDNPGASMSFWRSAFEGVVRFVLLILYMVAVSFMKDIRRTFMYHGAEHKTIFCYEKGLELTVENVRKQSRFHPRCGTSFLILMVLVGIFIGFFIRVSSPLLRTGIKILLLPLTVGIGYELIRFAGKHDGIVTRIISAPGKWVQRITTKEPDDSMIECAILAVKEVIPDDPEKDNW